MYESPRNSHFLTYFLANPDFPKKKNGSFRGEVYVWSTFSDAKTPCFLKKMSPIFQKFQARFWDPAKTCQNSHFFRKSACFGVFLTFKPKNALWTGFPEIGAFFRFSALFLDPATTPHGSILDQIWTPWRPPGDLLATSWRRPWTRPGPDLDQGLRLATTYLGSAGYY